MTLLIAGTNGSVAWMVADTAISNPLTPVQTRLNRPKIIPARNKSLIGYAGDADVGELAIFQASILDPGRPVIDALAAVQKTHGSVEFAYAYMVDGHSTLVKIADGQIHHENALFLGDHQAFQDFQTLRHQAEVDPPPDAVGMIHAFLRDTLESETNADIRLPPGLTTIIRVMTLLFARNSDRHVGGFVVPFVLTKYGAQLLCYRFSISDAVTRTLAPGSLLPQGTAAGGGYDMEMLDLPGAHGFYVFILQVPGGFLYTRRNDGYEEARYEGNWPQFQSWLTAKTGTEVGHGSFGAHIPQKKTALWGMFDTRGKLVQGVASSGTDYSVSHLHTGTEPFKAMPDQLPLKDSTIPPPPDGIRGALDETRSHLSVRLDDGKRNSLETSLDAEEVDELIRHLSALRAQMSDPVPGSPHSGVHPFNINPSWRTYPRVHPEFPGVGLGLRSPGLGWQMYLIPTQESEALGKSLCSLAIGSMRLLDNAVGQVRTTESAVLEKGKRKPSGKARKGRKKRR
jgi:hypothetical protein